MHLFVLIVVADGQYGGIGQVRFENAVADFPLEDVLVVKRSLVAIGQHTSPAQPSVEGQRAADIDVTVVIVIAAAAGAGLSLPLRGRTLAHHVDGRRRVACAGGAAHDFDAVLDDGVRIGLHVLEGVEHPVDLEIVDRVAAG